MSAAGIKSYPFAVVCNVDQQSKKNHYLDATVLWATVWIITPLRIMVCIVVFPDFHLTCMAFVEFLSHGYHMSQWHSCRTLDLVLRHKEKFIGVLSNIYLKCCLHERESESESESVCLKERTKDVTFSQHGGLLHPSNSESAWLCPAAREHWGCYGCKVVRGITMNPVRPGDSPAPSHASLLSSPGSMGSAGAREDTGEPEDRARIKSKLVSAWNSVKYGTILTSIYVLYAMQTNF